MSYASGDGPLLASLALLKANWDVHGHTYTDNFVPFVAHCLLKAPGQRGTATELRQAIEEAFGIRMPEAALVTVLSRAVRGGLCDKDRKVYQGKAAPLRRYDLTESRDRALREQANAVKRFRSYAGVELGTELTNDQAESALQEYVERHPTDAMRPGPGTANVGAAVSTLAEYAVAKFISAMADSEPAVFDYVTTLVQGSMIASLLYTPMIAAPGRRFRRTSLFLDTPVLLRALGHEGPELQATARELLDLAFSLGAELACFTHTLNETRGILQGVAAGIGGHRTANRYHGPVETYLVSCKLTSSDVQILVNSLENDLRTLRVRARERPDRPKAITVDEAALESVLTEGVRYHATPARTHDLESLVAVHNLRDGEPQYILEDCRAIFVTTNRALGIAAKQFFCKDEPNAWAPAILDSDLATLLWLKKPLVAPQLPRRQVIADCVAALRPSGTLWGKYLEELEKLKDKGRVSEEQVLALRYSLDAQRILVDETKGFAENLGEAAVASVTTRALAAITGPLVAERDALASALRSSDALAAEALGRAEEAQASRSGFERRVRVAAVERANSLARLAASVCYGVLVLAILAFVWGSLPAGWVDVGQSIIPGPAAWVFRGLFGVGLVVTALHAIQGHSVRSITQAMELSLSKRFETRYLKASGLDPLDGEGSV